MSGIKNLSNAIRNAINSLNANRERDAVQAASNLYAQIQNRVIQRGETAGGGKFPPYSTRQIPKRFWYGKGRNSTANMRIRNAKGNLSYTDIRRFSNLQTRHRDFYFTGDMWRGTGVQVQRRLLRSTVVRIAGRTPTAIYRLEKNSEREGRNILEPSQAEIDAVKRAYAANRLKNLKF